MNPRAAALLIALVVIAVALLIGLALWAIRRQVNTRVRTLERDRNLLGEALIQIEASTDTYRDIDSVLATDIRRIIRDLNKDRMERYR